MCQAGAQRSGQTPPDRCRSDWTRLHTSESKYGHTVCRTNELIVAPSRVYSQPLTTVSFSQCIHILVANPMPPATTPIPNTAGHWPNKAFAREHSPQSLDPNGRLADVPAAMSASPAAPMRDEACDPDDARTEGEDSAAAPEG